jgi:hypothetical protein
MIDWATCRANAAKAATFAASLTDVEVRLIWEQTALHWIEKAEFPHLRERPSDAKATRASKMK